ncbi:DUF5693 family protein [Alkaliphilus transvaalensis]|uniref:DUF5693 family protein n=1 Tax=Alkaliphilus transvaalensis TaxID=114628 RepID=UPI00047EA41B|nr:DUF5693 family protein [Alkaliphilus transvaalensis]
MKKNNFLIGILIISFLVTAFTFVGRISTEYHNDTVDIVLDYYEFVQLAETSEESLSWWFEEFNRLGVQYVAIREETIASLIEEGKPLQVEMVGNIISDLNWKDNYPAGIVNHLEAGDDIEFDVLLISDSKETFDFVSEKLLARYDEEKFTLIEDEAYYSIILKGTREEALFIQDRAVDEMGRVFQTKPRLISSKLLNLGLGLDPEKVELIQNSGLKVMPRPYQYLDWLSERLVFATFNEYETYGIKPTVLIFDGDDIFGYPDYTHVTKNYMVENDIKVGLIERSVQREYIKQKGIDPLIKALDYNATGVFSMPEFVQMRFAYYHYSGSEEIENTLYRAVTERNMRLIYFRPFKIDRTEYVTDLVEYENMFQRFEARLSQHGMAIGDSSAMAPFKVRLAFQIIMGWGIVAAGILLINTLFKLKQKYNILLMAVGALFVIGILMIRRDLAANLLAITAAIVFASLSMIYFIKQTHKYLQEKNEGIPFTRKVIRSAKDLLIASLISSIGAVYVASILADIEYFIAMNVYRGVKISQLVPFVVFAIAYLAYFGYRRKDGDYKVGIRFGDIKRLLMEDVKVIYVFLAGIVLVVGYIYIARTGHATGLQASAIEMRIRNFLGDVLMARPRTKEFLIAFPALMMGVYLAHQYKYKIFIFATGLAAVMGQTSIINTFSHFRTPIYLSAIRTVYSLGLGILVAIIFIALLEVGVKLIKVGAEKFND